MNDLLDNDAQEPLIASVRGLSLIWLVPLLAALIGGWIAWKSWSEQGPTLTITFEDGQGLEEGKTKVRYRNLEMGTITRLHLDDDRRRVIATAELKDGAEDLLSKATRFWVVRPRIGISQVSGLDTLLSGAYVEMDVGTSKADGTRRFTGLETPPTVSVNTAGRHFRLFSDRRGSITQGSLVLFRSIPTGIVTDVKLATKERRVEFDIFVRAPFDKLVTKNTVFWDAGGLSVNLDADGLKVNVDSLESLVAGGIAFGLQKGVEDGDPAAANSLYFLHESEKKAEHKRSTDTQRYRVFFTDSLRGLNIGAPVEFRGIRIGEVLDIDLEYNPDNLEIRTPVLVEIELDRIEVIGKQLDPSTPRKTILSRLIEKGLRATVKSGNLMTGAQYVDLVVLPDAPLVAGSPEHTKGYPMIPSISSGLNLWEQRVNKLFTRLDTLPIEEIGGNLNKSLAQLHLTITELNKILKPIDKRAGINTQAQLMTTMKEFGEAARAIRDLARLLENNPQSLLLGKPASGKRKTPTPTPTLH
ncbi:MAG: MCE family protein [Gammaproteobacteria bacterium]|nr:MCE family protein [Gammaproteobacteria bacterium]MBU1653863.1 MCE family protein [Gammaproteobacteria bacterium]MBU1960410.1 MCE family protein [Gammaproteobacteria bacterium]